MKLYLLFVVIISLPSFINAQSSWQEAYSSRQDAIKHHLLLPNHLSFSNSISLAVDSALTLIDEYYQLSTNGYQFEYLDQEYDKLGATHLRYIQIYKGIPVEGSMYKLHVNAQGVYAASGHFYNVHTSLKNVSRELIDESEALEKVLRRINARSYQWESSQAFDSRSNKTDQKSNIPKGKLVYVPENGNFQSPVFHLAWKFEVYALEPLSKSITFVEAVGGNVLHQIEALHTNDTLGTAFTRFSGKRDITSQYIDNQFVLSETGRGGGIFTWDMNDTTDFSLVSEIYDQDNIWNHSNDSIDIAALDAHWGAEVTYDFFLEKFGRNSFDNKGANINCYVHYGKEFNNAFWDGSRVVFGNSNGKSFSTLDIVAHELAHGVTQYTSQLIYQDESGALNESFSDIMGKAVEYFYKPESFTWNIGKDRGLIFRSMEDPELTGHPRNYMGARWYRGKEDNGGVHINSGVQNYWFYLLVNGGIGINDFGENYQVNGLGMDTALAVIYRTYTVYLTPSSTYKDARYFSTLAAIDLFGACSNVHQAITNAWHAVGLDQPFSEVPVADFSVSTTELCTQPYTVEFSQEAANSFNYVWDFGDGTKDTLANPTHTYDSTGTYPVTLIVDGFCGEKDTLIRESYITINSGPPTPVTQPTFINCGENTFLTASTGGELRWYDQWGEYITSRDTLFLPALNDDITYYARNLVYDPPIHVGPVQDSIRGEGGYHNTEFQSRIYFRVMRSMRINSMAVDAAEEGKRILILEDGTGTLIRRVEVDVPAGKSRIELNLDLSPGSYRLGGSYLNLYRHETGANYPYEVENIISITGSPPDAGPSFYYYFYDWSVSSYCLSNPSTVQVFVSPISPPNVPDTSRCGPGSLTLTAEQDVNWYSETGDLLHSGKEFETPTLDTSTVFFTESFIEKESQFVGPEEEAFSSEGGFHNTEFNARLNFEVYKPLRIKSVYVHAREAGTRRLILEDPKGDMIEAFSIYIPAGPGRINLDLDVQPGKYALGGQFLDLYRNTSGARYPYVIEDLISITGSNALTFDDYYYYFYNWEVTETPCYSTQVPVNVEVLNQLTAAFTYQINKDTLSFEALTEDATYWHWDFGDGNTDSSESPIYVYQDTGKYEVTLLAGNDDCIGIISIPIHIENLSTPQDVISNITDSLSTKIRVYPNPADKRVTIGLESTDFRSSHLSIVDARGRSLIQSPAKGNVSVDVANYPQGIYTIIVTLGDHRYYKKLLINR